MMGVLQGECHETCFVPIYTTHLAALSTDSSTRACDKAKLRGYYNK